ncbi:MAG: hydroxymethylglutaryl-CoA lyase [Legionellales bacterium RIFCSPHIGHO2_12_FULL_37_14]|nr:MAG: hydroxymethylglutaryl-CoA lyase [Legionellales bacterium RIFCSPHIGHO2_12_FULL_37_14]
MKTNAITLFEVSPRDGLQNEPKFISTKDKLYFIKLLSETGVKHIEATSFVSPKKIPQLKDSFAIMQALPCNNDIEYSVLIPNIKGLEKALLANVKAISLFTAASESFNKHNINCSIQESIKRFAEVILRARQENLRIRAYVSCALGCPYEGAIKPSLVAKVCESLLKLGVNEISLADTIGVGTPKQTKELIKTIQPLCSKINLAMHFHDTYGQALANILCSLEAGISHFDTSVAGLGGCPYAPGASGNVATEDVLYFMHGLGLNTNIDIYKMIQAGQWICDKMHRKNLSKVANAMQAKFHKD